MECCIFKVMSLNARLAVLCKSPETVQLKDLVGQPPSLIVGARKVTTRFGRLATVLNIQRADIITSVFLPNKFTEALDDTDLETIVQEGYHLNVTSDKEGTSPNAVITKE